MSDFTRIISKELTANPNSTIAKEYPNVTVLFTDIVGFTEITKAQTSNLFQYSENT